MHHSDPSSRTDLLLTVGNVVSRQLPGVNFFSVYSVETLLVQGHAFPWEPASSNGAKSWPSQSHMAFCWVILDPEFPGWVDQGYGRPTSEFDFFLCPISLLSPCFHRCWSLICLSVCSQSTKSAPYLNFLFSPSQFSWTQMVIISICYIG